MSSVRPPDTFSMGFARADITPPPGVTLVGYRPRISTSVAHPLRAEASACSGQGGRWLLVTGDFLGIEGRDTDRVRVDLSRETGFPIDAIAVAGTHTHSGPATVLGPDAATPADRLYLEDLWRRLVAVGRAAVADLSPATLSVARTTETDLGSNRRVQDDKGVWVNEWRDPDGRHPGYFDPTVAALCVLDARGRRRALLVNYGVHPVVLGPESLAISPDYPGYLKADLEARGAASTVVFLLANINPRVCIETDPGKPLEMGRRLARTVAAALDRGRPVGGGPVRSAHRVWEIRRTRDAYKGRAGPGSRAGDVVRTELQAFRAGEVLLFLVPGELFSELNAALRDLSPGRTTLVVSLANDYVGYLPTDRAQEEGAYETLMAPAVGIEGDLLARAREVLSDLGV